MTSTTISNLALARLGEARIGSLVEDSASGRACSLLYDPTRREVLRSHRWNFAIRRVVLTEEATEPLFGWEHQFPLPDDCLRVLDDETSETQDVVSEPYLIEGRRILTDADEFNLIYIRDEEDVEAFDPLFIDALAVRLAAKLTESLRGSTGKTVELLEEYARITGPLARRIDANEGKRRKPMIALNSSFVRSRSAAASGFQYTHGVEWV